MRVVWAILLLFLLTGCDAPGEPFKHVPATRVQIGETLFDVRVRGEIAEAIRVNVQYAPRLGWLRTRSGFAMAQVSGCAVEGVLGDQAVMLGVLICPGRRPKRSGGPDQHYDCEDLKHWARQQRRVDLRATGC